jgi:hypothetical protein
MFALTRSLTEFRHALGVVGAAIASAAALRMSHRPDAASPARTAPAD